MTDGDPRLTVLMNRYQALKAEQLKRVATRDNVLYLMVVSIGAVISLGSKQEISPYIYLIPPWICVLLGCVHVINDQKVVDLDALVADVLGQAQKIGDGWEDITSPTTLREKSESTRRLYRGFLLSIKVIAFIIPGLVSLYLFLESNGGKFWRIENETLAVKALVLFEAFMLMSLLTWLDRYRSIRGRWNDHNDSKASSQT